MCPCLTPLDHALKAHGFKEDFRGAPWSKNCREWVYYDVLLDKPAVRAFFSLPGTITDHDHCGTHDGAESGFFCTRHNDGVMGVHPKMRAKRTTVFSPK